ncbi:N-acetylmuramoyl-L-alanine amidase [Alcanivorax hongdengensis A-11-3]|uniref:N-acetylmuramoyl-L-alanine amidase AmiC n=1 Tax=Alcanivorax hongdengensis A-11-3 TaxID=1177179 RepID=L0WGI2_9GAMM|nr:N-acetylmuramoyl-L-alanine amidase [Alcanivorax hongdengensis]EKF75948.1 N-acetylmuramoyl-L-alanine amidase [Alcanivorax hongdengensis A-11-3]
MSDARNNNNGSFVAGLVLALITLFWSGAVSAQATIESVRLHRAPDHTRIVFDLPSPVDHRIDKLANPDRIVVDLMDATLDFDVSTLDYGDSPIANIRVGKHSDKTRVVFDMKQAVRPRTNLLKPIDPHGWRLVVDLFDKDGSSAEPVKTVTRPEPKPQPTGDRPMIVAVDAGHGGEDPGAHGPSGTYEKNITLQIAKRLAAKINAAPGMKAELVRNGDYYVPLAERRTIARNKFNADVFISIHADAFTDASAHGASVFALSNRGATSAKARYLAKIANESDKVAGVYEDEKDDSNLLSVLADLQVTGSVSHSLYLGRQVLDQLDDVTRLHGGRHRVEQAGFAVLKEPKMVSILVETGFISNRNEERQLRSSSHQDKIAEAILKGVQSYFRTHPAPGSWFAAQRRARGDEYRIQPGDTLSEIATQYSVSEDALRAANDLQSDRIMVGQVLKIPRS